ncbi:MAG: hypothetical protein H6719_29055 [Sandaracinaceae bacterium]|nr:hypothetical protein [Sandaracinaceae bacterium]
MPLSTRTALALVTLIVVGCGGESPSDGGLDGAAGTTDAGSGSPDAGADASCAAGSTRELVDLGHCFEARTCCVAADCGSDRAWRCNEEGLCEEDGRACGCADDLDCPGGSFCFTNAVVCGVCAPTRPPCTTDAPCGAGGRCADGYCVDETCTGYPSP